MFKPSMPEPGIAEKIAFLSKPEAYAGRVTCVETKETHMSCVFLANEHVWKLKKPARYDYLDFSTVEARKRDCELEVELNRRLAPGVYLDIVPLVIDAHDRMRLGGEGRIVDWLVMMRRLPGHRMLDVAIAERTLGSEDVRKIGLLLAKFYQHAQRVPLSPLEYRSRLEAEIAECARELRKPQYALPPELIESILAGQIRVLKQDALMFDERARQGKIVDAHGDLRPEHICTGPEPVVIDCLEFNADFRILDPASELAFFALECERLGAPWVGKLVLDTYQGETGDVPPERLLVHYKKHHACVRAKIAVWHLRDPGVHDSAKWIDKAKDYLQRAQSLQQLDD